MMYPPEKKHDNGKLTALIGDTPANGRVSFVMLVFGVVTCGFGYFRNWEKSIP